MGLFDGNEMRGMTHANYEDSRLNKSRELNENMSIKHQNLKMNMDDKFIH
ncbi:hypothetical protein CoNPh35_CDS0003 [Staphylococcus phage S-CoN_Ph35]|nr:hypothetical protein CoNPh35_CDS0003 [Staphylococcus phage S-CoN_Ph35]